MVKHYQLLESQYRYLPGCYLIVYIDLLESGKIRSRVFSEPLRGSPTHSPMNQPRGSPLQRASLNNSTEISPSTPPSRVSQTLPPPAHTPPEATTDSNTNVIPRRPTYPLNRKSAFNPVSALGATSLSEDELASTATLTMTASQVSIAGELRCIIDSEQVMIFLLFQVECHQIV